MFRSYYVEMNEEKKMLWKIHHTLTFTIYEMEKQRKTYMNSTNNYFCSFINFPIRFAYIQLSNEEHTQKKRNIQTLFI